MSFFFQAEDGIRDRNVTGVQTCALPILAESRCPRAEVALGKGQADNGATRSEERRVGKECRSRWSTDHLMKKKPVTQPNTHSRKTRANRPAVEQRTSAPSIRPLTRRWPS